MGAAWSGHLVSNCHGRLGVVHGTVSGNPVEHYVGIDPERNLPLMICLDARGRHWLTDGARSTVVYPPRRDTGVAGEGAFTFDYQVDHAVSLLATVEPIRSEEPPFDALVYANWLVLAVNSLVAAHPRGTLGIERVVLDRDPTFDSNQLRIKIQGVDRLFRTRWFLPRRPGHFLIEIIARENCQVVLLAKCRLLGLAQSLDYEVRPGAAHEQAREILEEILEFIWRCSPELGSDKSSALCLGG